MVEKILRSMTSRFNYVVCSIEESNDVTTFSINELQSNFLVQEARMTLHKKKEEEQLLKVSNSRRGRTEDGGFTHGRGRNGARGRGRGRQSKEMVEYYKCHYQNECPIWEENTNTGAKDEVWFLDSRCNNHMIANKEWLFNFNEQFS